jgi:manganese oxidase
MISEIDPNWHTVIESGAAQPFYPPNWKPELWFVNGRTFPTTVLSFAWNTPTGGTEKESRYNTYIRVNAGQKFLVRWINMGYQEHPMHQHGWHMAIIGSDARPYVSPVQKYTLLIGSGETYDAITTADPTYGADGNPVQGSRLGTNAVAPGQGPSRNFRQIFPIHDHDDYRVTTNGIYPGGAVILMEGFNGNGGRLPGSVLGTPTFLNVYVNAVQAVPQPPV